MPVNFWLKLKKSGRPILALAPLAGFTDSSFRQLCKSYGADVLYSEMVSATALFYNANNKTNASWELMKHDRRQEKHYVVQLFGADPKHFALAARLVSEKIKPDGIDINFGCPVPKVMKQGAGAALMKDLERSRAVIKAVLDNTDLPVSIKIRTRSGDVDALKFLKNIADLPVAGLMIHGRSLNQGFSGVPDFFLIKKVRRYFKGVILANGGINSLADARLALKDGQADGLGLGRGALGRPWLFKEIKTGKEINFSRARLFALILKHAARSYKQKGKTGIIELRKHLVWYFAGQPGASKTREKLVKVSSLKEIKKVLK